MKKKTETKSETRLRLMQLKSKWPFGQYKPIYEHYYGEIEDMTHFENVIAGIVADVDITNNLETILEKQKA